MIRLLVVVMMLCVGTTAYAEDSYPVAWGPVSATFGPSGLTMPAGKFAIGGNFLFGKSDGLWRHSKRINGNVKTRKINEIIKMRYGIWDGLDVRFATPIYNVHLDKSAAPNFDVYGVGDTTMAFHQRLLSQKAGDPLSVAFDIGAVLPTGTVSSHSSDPAGNATWGVVGGLGATYFIYANRFDTEVNYTVFAEGAHDYQKGNRMRWNASYAYALNNFWDIGVESTLEMSTESHKYGEGQNDAYLEWYAGPKIVCKYNPWGIFAGVAFKVPVKRWYQETKAGSDDFQIDFKLIKAF